MSAELDDLTRLCDAVFSKHVDRTPGHSGSFDPALWEALSGSGLTLISVPESAGGSGGELADAAVVLEAVGRYAAPVPLAETAWLAAWLLNLCGAQVPAGPMSATADTAGVVTRDAPDGVHLNGRVPRCAWARDASAVILLTHESASARVSMVPGSIVRIVHDVDIAGEPTDDIFLDDIVIEADESWNVPHATVAEFQQRAVLSRSIRAAGAAQAVLDLVLDHVASRTQFGKALREFQAVQQMVARLAGLTSMMKATSFAAVPALVDGTESERHLAVSAAALIASESAGEVAALGHQLLGAIGTTQEHDLHRSTTRLWSLREAYGNELTLARGLGQWALGESAGDPWAVLTG